MFITISPSVSEEVQHSKNYLKPFIIIIKHSIFESYIHSYSNNAGSIFNHPLLAAKRTVLGRAFLSPFENAVEMEVVEALALDWHTVVAWYFASRTGRLEGELADSAAFLCFDVPLPSGHCVPGVYLDFHIYLNNLKPANRLE